MILEAPCFPQDWSWSNQGYPTQCNCMPPQQQQQYQLVRRRGAISQPCDSCECVAIYPSQHQETWKNNYLCAKKSGETSPQLQFSSSGRNFNSTNT